MKVGKILGGLVVTGLVAGGAYFGVKKFNSEKVENEAQNEGENQEENEASEGLGNHSVIGPEKVEIEE